VLRLFAGSGSQEIQLLQPSALPAVWSRTRDKVARLLRQRGQTRAADLFLSLPFELWDGTNGFNDEFVLLYAELPMQKYVEIADLEDDPNQRALFRQIEAALGETDTHVRFIAAALGEGVEPTFVAAPVPSISSDVLEQALVDVERSLAGRADRLPVSTGFTPPFIPTSATSRGRPLSAFRTRVCRNCSKPFAKATQRSSQRVPALRT